MSGYRSTNAIGGGADVGIIAMTNPGKISPTHARITGERCLYDETLLEYTAPLVRSDILHRNDTAGYENWCRHDTLAAYLPKHTHSRAGYLHPKSWSISSRGTAGKSC